MTVWQEQKGSRSWYYIAHKKHKDEHKSSNEKKTSTGYRIKTLVQYICNEFNVASVVSTCLFLLLVDADGLE